MADYFIQKLEEERRDREKEKTKEDHIISFIEKVIHERPQGDFQMWIRDAVVLSKVMTAIVYNSVPKEDIRENWGSGATRERARELIRQMMRYGVHDVFEPDDLVELKNMGKVTRCVDELAKMAEKDKSSPLYNRMHGVPVL